VVLNGKSDVHVKYKQKIIGNKLKDVFAGLFSRNAVPALA